MPLVVDASVTIPWCIETEATAYADVALDLLRDGGGLVPAVWPLEVTNALLMAERRQRLTTAEAERALALLASLPITVDDVTLVEAVDRILPFARQLRLSVYDASYVALALREDLELATQDGRMRAAAAQLGVRLLEGPAIGT